MIIRLDKFNVHKAFNKFQYLKDKEAANASLVYLGFDLVGDKSIRKQILEWIEIYRPNEIKVYNFKISWCSYEVPFPSEIDEVVILLLKILKLDREKAIYGVHLDTENLHVHLLVYLSRECAKIKFNNDVQAAAKQIAVRFGFDCFEHKHAQSRVRLPQSLRNFLKYPDFKQITDLMAFDVLGEPVLVWDGVFYRLDKLPKSILCNVDLNQIKIRDSLIMSERQGFELMGLNDLFESETQYTLNVFEGSNPRPMIFDVDRDKCQIEQKIAQCRAVGIDVRATVSLKNGCYFCQSNNSIFSVDLRDFSLKLLRLKSGFDIKRELPVNLFEKQEGFINILEISADVATDTCIKSVKNGDPSHRWWSDALCFYSGKIHRSRELIFLKAIDEIFSRCSNISFCEWGVYAPFLDRAVQSIVRDFDFNSLEVLIQNQFKEFEVDLQKRLIKNFLAEDDVNFNICTLANAASESINVDAANFGAPPFQE